MPALVTGSVPPNKSDLKAFGVYLEENDTDKFMHLFWTRVQDPRGTTNMDFEFNQATAIGPDIPARTDGDLLIEYNLAKGGTVPKLYRYTWIDGSGTLTVSDCEASTLPCWGDKTDLTASGDAAGSINTSAISAADSDGMGALDPYTFGEASVDLKSIFDPNKCTSFGSVYLKSRSSDSFTSALKDFIKPHNIELSNCGTVIIRKNTLPSGATESFGFTSNLSTYPAGDSSFWVMGGDSKIFFNNVLAGKSYWVTEDDPDSLGWDLTSIDCQGSAVADVGNRRITFDISVGETLDCTFTNSRKPILTVTKVVVSDDGGNIEYFPLFVDGNPVDSGVENTFDIGVHTISEEGDPGYAATFSGDCQVDAANGSITLNYGDVKSCIITNDDIAPDLTVLIEVRNNDGGGADETDFAFNVEATDLSLASISGTELGGITVDAGDYNITASTVPEGYTLVGEEGCIGSIDLAEVRTCTLIYEDIAPSLMLVKRVSNDNGGAAVPDDWILHADNSGVDGSSRDISKAGGSGVFQTVFANNGYDLSESGATLGYSAVSWTCDLGTLSGSTITLGLNEDVTCTIINDDIPPTLTVHKTDDAASPSPLGGATFTLWKDNNPSDGTGRNPSVDTETHLSCTTDASGDCTISDIHLGDYWVVESFTPDGYDTAADQHIVLVAGAEETLTFVNPRQFTMIVLVCEESTNRLYASLVTLATAGGAVTTSLDPNALVDLQITDAQPCSLAGARYEDLNFGQLINDN